jgi:DNA-binding NarL/FixJ family response regulator
MRQFNPEGSGIKIDGAIDGAAGPGIQVARETSRGRGDQISEFPLDLYPVSPALDLQRSPSGVRPISTSERGSCNIVIIENSPLLSSCIARAIGASFACSASVFSTAEEFVVEREALGGSAVILSCVGRSNERVQRDLELIVFADPRSRTIVLGQGDDPGAALFAIGHGAKAYIPTTIGWEIAIEAIRMVIAGGTYIPVEYVVALHGSSISAAPRVVSPVGTTERERTVLRAIRQGKPNKVIANELKVCESTVKAHVRNIMIKFHARNRTELAIKSAEIVNQTLT